MTSTSAADDRAVAHAHLLAGRIREAVEAYRALVEAQPHAPNLRYDLGAALSASGDQAAADDAWSTARVFHGLALLRELGVDMDRFAAEPDFAAETGRSLAANGMPGVAAAALARALEAGGPEPQLLADYAVCLLHQGAVEQACEILGMASDSDLPALMPLMLAAYGFIDDGGVRRSLLARQAAAGLNETSAHEMPVSRTAGQPLKVGYIPGAALLEARFLAVIARHDPQAVEAALFLDNESDAPEGFSAFSIAGLDDAEAAAAIGSFGLDILVDLSGAAGGRLGLFARRPAPVQVSWCADVTTTGLAVMDAKLVPSGCAEPDAPMLFSERLMAVGPAIAPWPVVTVAPRQNPGRLTIGAFMSPALLTADMIAVLAQVTCADPQACLMLKHPVMDDPVIQRTLAARFLACGLARERIEFRGMAGDDLDEFDFEDVDLAIDSRPSMGEAQVLSLLGRGIPVLCASGPTTAGRLAAAPLRALGLDDLVAEGLPQLARRAMELAADRTALNAVRDRIEAAFTASAYGDSASIARRVESAFDGLVQQASLSRRWA